MARIIWWTGLAFRFVVPVVFKAILFTLKLALTALLSVWSGIPQATRRIANHWLMSAVVNGIPSEFETSLYYILQGAAFITILTGWVILSYLTTWLLGLIF